MTKRRDLIKQIRAEARRQDLSFTLRKHGACHDIWLLGSQPITIPRHAELDDSLARTIYAQCQSTLGKGWWR